VGEEKPTHSFRHGYTYSGTNVLTRTGIGIARSEGSFKGQAGFLWGPFVKQVSAGGTLGSNVATTTQYENLTGTPDANNLVSKSYLVWVKSLAAADVGTSNSAGDSAGAQSTNTNETIELAVGPPLF